MTDTTRLSGDIKFTMTRWANKKRSTVIPPLETFIVVIELPWYKSWLRRNLYGSFLQMEFIALSN